MRYNLLRSADSDFPSRGLGSSAQPGSAAWMQLGAKVGPVEASLRPGDGHHLDDDVRDETAGGRPDLIWCLVGSKRPACVQVYRK